MLESKGAAVEEIIVAGDTPGWDEMIERTGGRTTPQILIDGVNIGGYTELASLNAEGVLDEKLGLDGSSQRNELYDVIIIGSGPAGMSAAIYSSRKGMKTLILSKDVGGQLNITAELENYLGFELVEAQDLIAKFDEHVNRFDIKRMIGEEVERIEVIESIKVVHTATGNRYQCKTLVIASGKQPRPLGVPGEERLMGKGVAYCATCDAPFYKNRKTAVVGGGNSALEAAGDLNRVADKVFLLVRGKYTADAVAVDRMARMERLEVFRGWETLEVLGENEVSGVRIKNRESGEEKTLEIDGLFVEAGLLPNSAFAMDALDVNEIGEIKIDCQTETGVPGVFAAGDVTTVKDKQVIVASGEGAKAALRAHEYIATKR